MRRVRITVEAAVFKTTHVGVAGYRREGTVRAGKAELVRE